MNLIFDDFIGSETCFTINSHYWFMFIGFGRSFEGSKYVLNNVGTS